MIHRNTYVNAPSTLEPTFETRQRRGLFFAGQMSGVEGYVESAASGLLAGVGAAFRAPGRGARRASRRTRRWARSGRYIARSDPEHYQPTNIAFGLLPELPQRVRDKARRRMALAERALGSLERFQSRLRALESSPRTASPPSPEADVQAEIAAFLRHLDRERNASPHTVRAYGEDLEQFARHVRTELGREGRPRDVDHLLIRAFLARLHRQGLKSVSAARKLATLRTFFRYLCREGRPRPQPGAVTAVAAAGEARARPTSTSGTCRSWSRCPATATPRLAARAILELLYATGIRCSELVGLDVAEIDSSRPDDPSAG